jgi:GntR family transcriptional regulator
MKTSVPLYHHLKNALMKQLQSGKLSPGEMIPSEPELARQYNVSRTTVRQAIGDLVSSGYLVRQQGKGTFVAKRNKTMATSPLYGFAEELRQRGAEVAVRVHSIDITPCPAHAADKLEITSVPVIHISRTAHIGNTCIFRESSYLVPPLNVSLQDLLKRKELFDHIYGFFEQHGVKIGLARQTVGAEQATVEDTEVFNVPLGEPVLVIRRVTQDITGTPVEFSEVRYPGSLYEYEINLHRQER